MTSAPTPHQLRAAARVLHLLGGRPCALELARRTYGLVSTAGEHASTDLVAAERLLITLGLVTRTTTMLRPVALPFELDAGEEESVALVERVAAAATLGDFLDAIGALGEESAVRACRSELDALGYGSLAAEVNRVSLISDSFGYDVSAPCIGGGTRLLEVKTQFKGAGQAFRFFLTRHEYDVGRDDDSWYLLACSVRSLDTLDADVLGWCTADALRPYLPADANGRWTEATVQLPRTVLKPGLPPVNQSPRRAE